MRYELYKNGVCIQVIDERTVSSAALEKINEIKTKCKEAIEGTGMQWMVEREVSGGKPVPEEVKSLCAFYRSRSNELEELVETLSQKAIDDNDKIICDQIQQVSWEED
jgi:hypothetical protein